ncbi:MULTISPECIES: cell envelope integrity protein TolA [unclassified Paraburkholderia]|uniref:cell envelope integrity protein TolA n=1 Tax=unclassified Paraburkholderia TaxID=2615204 RepID=UPI001607DFB6|nr:MULTISPECIES: cell envelope integrity protein TolA [unclassified Paraburkholderia]MBB5447874.1 colicin import membrane protein [Paraburkholderia sp. WSM4177]MBB5485614.1 colicin import membrane protein [Paraburkholderia sp. WSM4180]
MIRKNSEYPLQPPRERGTGRAFLFALVMHALLGFFLYHGIQWQNSTPEGEQAELWTEVPDSAIPRPVVTPPPTPVAPAPPVRDEQADIALQEKKRQQQEAARAAQLAEQQRQLKLKEQQEAEAKRQQQLAAEQAAQLAAQKAAKLKQQQAQQQQQQQAEKLKQQQLAEQQKQQQLKEQQEQQQKQAQAEAQKKAEAEKAAKAKAQADAAAQAKKQLDNERRARLAQMQGLAGGVGGSSSSSNGLGKSGTGSGSGGTAASPGYADKVRRLVLQHVNWGGETEGLETVIAVRCSPDGNQLSANITHSSGNAAWDAAALRAVRASDPMPRDVNGKTPDYFTITLRPAA